MKREIKFRAWHKIWKRMFDIDATHYIEAPEYGEPIAWDNEDFEFMQFTGLMDCSNRPIEIYEGDIIKVTHFDEGEADYTDMISDVIFESGVFGLKQRHIDEGEVCPLSCEEHYVVIGNIYQHPSLLEAK
jgi:hypothetical protein